MFCTCSHTIRVNHRNGVASIFFYTNLIQLMGSSADCSLFILSLHALALHLAVKILLQIFLVWRFEHVGSFYIHLSVVFPSRMPAGLHFVTQPILLSEKHSIYINHQQNTRRSDQIETIKTIMQTTRPRIMTVLPMAQVAIFKEIFRSSAKRFRLWIVLFWTKTSQRLTLYLLSSSQIISVMCCENDNTVLIKGLKKVVNVKFQETRLPYRNVLW